MSELSVHELDTQHGEVLPERETLAVVYGPIGNGFGNFSNFAYNDQSAANLNLSLLPIHDAQDISQSSEISQYDGLGYDY